MINIQIENIKARKNFYLNTYRKALIWLIFFLATQLVWVAMIAFVVIDHSHQVPDFYSSSSDGILLQLKPMPEPNRSGKPLLE